MAFTAWAASNSFSVGDVRRATTVQSSGLVFRCTVAGTSGSSEPSPWPVVRGITVQDGTVTWVAVSAVGEELNKLAPSAVIELFELDGTASSVGVDQVYRFHSGVNQDIDGDIVWNGNSYSRYPIVAGGFEYEGQGQLPRPQISISNVLSLMTTLILEYNDLVGATVKRIRTLKKYLDESNFTSGSNPTADPYASFPEEIFIIDRKVIENRELVTFELSATFDVAGVKLPRRQIVQNICPWTYKGEGCGYSGTDYYDINDQEVTDVADDVCSHRLTGCRARFGENGQLPYGGFPSAGLIG
nr:phage minor tail protein L (TIGR01600) [uncultured Mediterranean phage uvMED]